MVRLLTKSEVADLLDMRQAIACTETVYREQAEGRVRPWPPFVLGDGTPGDPELRVNAGSLPGLGRAGLRVGMSRDGAKVLLYDTAEERLVAICAYPFGQLRVGATMGLAVDRLARPDARRLVVIGTGRNALVSLEGVACVRKFDVVQAYSRQSQHRADFVRAAGRFGVEVEPLEAAQAAIRQADVVVLATSASEPVLRGDWLKPDAHVATCGIRCEIDDVAYLRAQLVVVSSREQEQRYIAQATDNTLLRLANEGRLRWADIAELGEVVAGRAERPDGITVFRESQGGFGDLALADWVYERAQALGRGHDVSFDG